SISRTTVPMSKYSYFDSRKKLIKVIENGFYENFVLKFEYDRDGDIIKEQLDNYTSQFPYQCLKYEYGTNFNLKTNKNEKVLKYLDYDKGRILEIYSYTEYGDLLVCITVENGYNSITVKEEKN